MILWAGVFALIDGNELAFFPPLIGKLEPDLNASTSLNRKRGNPFLDKDLILMQGIGLKDEKGKEIYEGDLVKGVDGNEGGPSEVFYKYGQWQPFAFLDNYDGSQFEVIGNIYENPELC